MNQVSLRKLEAKIIGLISLGFVLWAAVFIYRSSFIAIDGKRYFCLFDDAMISMRYAWNFSHGFGLVWNSGERVEGYSNFLMTLIMSFATLVFDKPTASLFIQVLGAGFMLGIAYTNVKIAGHFIQEESDGQQMLIRVLVFLCTLAYYPLAYWSLMGMETGLLGLLLALSVYLTLRYARDKDSAFLLSIGICLGLAYITRNDALIFAMPIWLYIAWEIYASRINREKTAYLLGAIGLYLLFVLGQMAFRYLYYDELMPNTYTLKLTGMPLLIRIQNGIGFVRLFFTETLTILILSTVDLIFGFHKRKLLLYIIVLFTILYQIFIGGDGWAYWRLLSPAVPLLLVLFIHAAHILLSTISDTEIFRAYFLRNPVIPRRFVANSFLILFLLVELTLAQRRFLPEVFFIQRPYLVNSNKGLVNIAIAIDQLTTRDATVGVVSAGVIPYFTGRKAIDFLGKSDRYIARLPPDLSGNVGWAGMTSVPGHNKYDLKYSIKTLLPTYVQRFAWGDVDLSQWGLTRYTAVEYYNGVTVFLLMDSPAVYWEKVKSP